MRRTGTTRRGALLAAGAAAGGLLTACSGGDDGDGSDGTTSAAAVRAAKALRVKSASTRRELLRQYDAVIERHPDEAARLAPLRGAVARHVTALSPPPRSPEKDESAKPSPSPTRSVSVSPTAAPSSAPSLGTAVGDSGDGGTTPSVSADPVTAVKALAAAERRAADAHADALVHAPPELARLLASLAAAGAAHAYLLTEGSPS
ncbi:hypothetical protein [Streptomyces sp. NBC_01716]|uniref:hypothetical protein n=1 Tax=Streptomyces sp. NBC_01716 TaxID=2975917 RepID=UPI002E33E60E|nr:hypothetical protein [Streptomyces sp. NBC_01716]